MSLSSAKAKLDAQPGDPATGYISKQDHKDSYDELVADTALTGATTAAGITVSGAVQVGATAGLVVGASGPKVLSGSGSPEGAVTAPVGSIFLRTDGGADTAAYYKTSGTGNTGWTAADTGTGDVVGPASATDNAVARFDGTTGKLVQNSGLIVDDSNNVTGMGTLASGAVTSSGAVQAAAGSGFVVGSSGPTMRSGTGSPEGAVTAPVGSIWFQTDSTVGVSHWRKASGTGNTGWVVMEGDTGWRNISAEAAAYMAALATPELLLVLDSLYIRRVNQQVHVKAAWNSSAGRTNRECSVWGCGAIGSGWNESLDSPNYGSGAAALRFAYMPQTSYSLFYHTSLNTLTIHNSPTTGTNALTANLSYTAETSWPTSLPGSAA